MEEKMEYKKQQAIIEAMLFANRERSFHEKFHDRFGNE